MEISALARILKLRVDLGHVGVVDQMRGRVHLFVCDRCGYG